MTRQREAVDWPALYDEHAADLAHYLTRLVGDRATGLDLMQDTFVRAMSHGDALRDPLAARAWLYKIATNLASDHRTRERLRRFIPFARQPIASAREISSPVDLAVRAALRAIPLAQASALVLHYYAGFTRQEIAGMTGLSEEGVKSRLARGRRAFLSAYRDQEGSR